MEIVPIDIFGVHVEVPFPAPLGISQARLEEFGAKICEPAKGLGLLIDAFIRLKQSGRAPGVKLRCAGSMTEGDALYVDRVKGRLTAAGLAQEVEWLPNVTREEKIAFLESLTVFSVPAIYSEAFGLYVIEALAAGVPVVLPNASAFPEIVAATGGGLLFPVGASEPESAGHLAHALHTLLCDPERARELGHRGETAVRRDFSLPNCATRLAAITREMFDASATAP